MEKRSYLWEIIFFETAAFGRTISESERARLYFDLTRGNGECIADTGGLKRIRCGPYGYLGTEGREVVFAEYLYPDIQKWIFLLLNDFPLPCDGTLSKGEKRILRQLKKKADSSIERFCEGLEESDS